MAERRYRHAPLRTTDNAEAVATYDSNGNLLDAGGAVASVTAGHGIISVLDDHTGSTTPPAEPSDGDTYVIPAGATGDWDGEDDNFGRFDVASEAWVFTAPHEGQVAYSVANANLVGYFGATWGGLTLPVDIGDLGDITLTAPADGEILAYDTDEFINRTLHEAGLALKNATAGNPGATNDNTEGYSVGSLWLNTTTGEVWVCTDATTDTAVWKSITQDRATVTASTPVTAAWGGRYILTGDNAQLTLPDPASAGGQRIEATATHSNGGDLIRNAAETINGASSDQAMVQWAKYTVQSDGTNYVVSVELAPA